MDAKYKFKVTKVTSELKFRKLENLRYYVFQL